MKVSAIKSSYAYTIPVMMGYLPLGFVFGFLLTQQGAAWWLAPLMSLLVFAGAAQFLAIGLIVAGASLFEVGLACLIVNLRHIFYGISILDGLSKNYLKKIYCIYTLTDENFALLSSLPRHESAKYAMTICGLNHLYWVFAALAGAVAGGVISFDIPGLEFSLTALFTVLAIEQFKRVPRLAFVFCAVVSYGIAILVLPDEPLFVAMCLAIALCMPIAANKQLKENGREQSRKGAA